jgi:hypothetical protein
MIDDQGAQQIRVNVMVIRGDRNAGINGDIVRRGRLEQFGGRVRNLHLVGGKEEKRVGDDHGDGRGVCRLQPVEAAALVVLQEAVGIRPVETVEAARKVDDRLIRDFDLAKASSINLHSRHCK